MLPKMEGMVTRGSIREYSEVMRQRYRGARSKKEKGMVLTEFVRVTGFNRKSAIRLLRGKDACTARRLGRPKGYSHEATLKLVVLWEEANRICSQRLQPFIPELLEVLERHGELRVDPEVAAELKAMSASTMDRRLHPYRQRPKKRGLSTTKPGTLLKEAIPLRTFGEWERKAPGTMQIDLVAHCGESSEGFYLTTLSAVDEATGWSEWEAIWGKGQQRVSTGIHKIRCRLPFDLVALNSDNGSEFINQELYTYCRREGVKFTRSRPHKKNDNALVEEKNGSVIRRWVGYGRYSTHQAHAKMSELYAVMGLYSDFFQPVLKLVAKSRQGSKVRKQYDVAQTPYHRVLATGVLTQDKKDRLERIYRSLNPAKLRRQMEQVVQELWTLEDRAVQPTSIPSAMR